MHPVNFHHKLTNFAKALNDVELSKMVLEKDSLVFDDAMATEVSDRINSFIIDNKDLLDPSDLPALQDLAGLVLQLEVRSGIAGYGGKPTILEKTINSAIKIIESERTKRIEVRQIIATMEMGSKSLIDNKLDFATVQKLKEAKKQAKVILQDNLISKDTRQAMEGVITQYDKIVESNEVLSILRSISKEIRKPVFVESNLGRFYTSEYVNHFFRLFNIHDKRSANEIINDLAETYKTDKQAWTEKWMHIRQKIWDASLEAQVVLKQDHTITFITGSNSSSIPVILKVAELAPALSTTPALIPTGQLVQHNIVPLSGELHQGISDFGINQRSLSGMEFNGLDVCVAYASNTKFKFNIDNELDFIKRLNHSNIVKEVDSPLPRLRIAVLRLLLMGADPNLFKQHIIDLKNQAQIFSTSPYWEKYAPLIGTKCKELGKTIDYDLQRGQVVAILKEGSDQPVYGMIEELDEDMYTVIITKEGDRDYVVKDVPKIMEDSILNEETSKAIPLSADEQAVLRSKIKSVREKLEDILKLFDTVKPFNFNPSELQLIKEPFPIVWASFSSSLDKTPLDIFGQEVKGEQLVKGQVALGTDIQLVFTHRDNVDQLQSLLKDHGVQVLSFEAAFFILGKDKEKYQ